MSTMRTWISTYVVKLQSLLYGLHEKSQKEGPQKHIKNLSWMFSIKLISMVVSFLATAYIARNLGPQNYGELSYAISFVGIFSFFAPLGIDQILYRDLIKHPDKKNEYLGSALVLRLISSTLAVIICTLSAILFSTKDVSLFLIFIISFSAIVGSFQLLSYEFLVESKSKYPSIMSFFIIVTINLLKIAVIAFDEGVIYLAVVVLLEPLLYSVGYIYLKSRFYRDVQKMVFNKDIAYLILKDSLPLVFTSVFAVIYARIDQVFIKNMIGSEAVGLYDSAVRLSEVSYFIPSILISALFPPIINAKKISEKLYYERLRKLLILLLFLSIGIAILTTFFSKYLILIIYGAGFMGALPVLCIYVWSNVGETLNMIAQQILVTEHMTKKTVVAVFFGMAVNVLLNLLWIPQYGIAGAAYATLVAYMVPFLSIFMFKKTRTLMINVLRHEQ